MRLFGIADLPTADPALTGWPWTNEGAGRPAILHDGEDWPRISIVTPSFNQGEFLERTIRSVLLQGYPNLEYIVVDGGSSDGSAEIIEAYAPFLAYHVSEPDNGYVHAINKGLARATGEILCWLNSDDFYLPGTMHAVMENLTAGRGRAAIVGHVTKVYADGRPPQKIIGHYSSLHRLLKFWRSYQMHQPSIFWRREVFESIGYLSEERDLIADFDYWVRIGRKFQFHNVDQILSCATHHERAKTADECRGYHEALRHAAKSYWGSRFSPSYWRLYASMFSFFTLEPHLQPVKDLFRPYYRTLKRQLPSWDNKEAKKYA